MVRPGKVDLQLIIQALPKSKNASYQVGGHFLLATTIFAFLKQKAIQNFARVRKLVKN